MEMKFKDQVVDSAWRQVSVGIKQQGMVKVLDKERKLLWLLNKRKQEEMIQAWIT